MCTMYNYSLCKVYKNDVINATSLYTLHIRQNDEVQELAQTNLRLSSNCTVNRQNAQKFYQVKRVRQNAQSIGKMHKNFVKKKLFVKLHKVW